MLILLTLTTAFGQGLQSHDDLTISDSENLLVDFDLGSLRPRSEQVQRIVNGNTTSDYQAVGSFVVVYNDNSMDAFCSGTLVTDDIVLTAAHCIEPMYQMIEESNVSGIGFVLGSDIGDGAIAGEYVISAEMHPHYNSQTIENDIGLAQLSSGISGAPTMCLNSYGMGDDWTDVAVDWVGFGITAEGGGDAGVKRTVKEPVVGVEPVYFFTDREGTNICRGDSGGAAIVEMTDGTRMLTGVTSFTAQLGNGASDNCEADGVVSAGARIDAALDWILSYTGDVTCEVSDDADFPDFFQTIDTVEDDDNVIDLGPGGGDFGGVDGSSGSSTLGGEAKAMGCSVTGAGGGFFLSLISLLGLIRRQS